MDILLFGWVPYSIRDYNKGNGFFLEHPCSPGCCWLGLEPAKRVSNNQPGVSTPSANPPLPFLGGVFPGEGSSLSPDKKTPLYVP